MYGYTCIDVIQSQLTILYCWKSNWRKLSSSAELLSNSVTVGYILKWVAVTMKGKDVTNKTVKETMVEINNDQSW